MAVASDKSSECHDPNEGATVGTINMMPRHGVLELLMFCEEREEEQSSALQRISHPPFLKATPSATIDLNRCWRESRVPSG